MNENATKFPRQKISFKQKGKSWRKEHLDWADKHSKLYNNDTRQRYNDKVINYNLLDGIINRKDMKAFLDPFKRHGDEIPDRILHYPVINNAIDLFVGEESARKIKLTAKAVNPEAISSMEERLTLEARQKILNYLKAESTQDEAKQEAGKLQEFMAYGIKDLEEVNDNYILQHYMKELEFDSKLLAGFKDTAIANEEAYAFDIVGGNPTMTKWNPKKVFTYRTSNSSRIEDADIIIYDDYVSPGKILDTHCDVLSKKDQIELERISNGEGSTNSDSIDERDGRIYVDESLENLESIVEPQETVTGAIAYTYSSGIADQKHIDKDGNLRVLRILWKSKTKVLKVKTYNKQTGEAEFSYKPEDYVVDKDLGEEAEEQWWTEWWEGEKIAKNIYTNMRPRPQQFRNMNNNSICHSGIIGQLYNTNEGKAYSPVDKMKQYQYLYDALHDRLIKLLTNHIGKVMPVDSAKIPAGWEPDQWLQVLRNENIAFFDSFKEGNKGAATGKLSGNYNQSTSSMDLDLGNSIQLYITLLDYCKTSMYDLVGISPQRMGAISTNESVGGVERSVSQSSHITAERYAIHDDVKKRCAAMLLETCKVAFKDEKNKKIMFVTNDGVNRFINIDGDNFSSKDHGIFIENELELGGLRENLTQLAQAWSQNQTVSPSTILQIMSDPSLTSIQRRIEKDLQAKNDKEQQAMESQQKSQESIAKENAEIAKRAQAIEELKMQFEKEKLALEKYNIDQTNQTKLDVARITHTDIKDDDNSFEEDKVSKEISLKEGDLSEKIRHNKEVESISKMKTKTI